MFVPCDSQNAGSHNKFNIIGNKTETHATNDIIKVTGNHPQRKEAEETRWRNITAS